MKTTFALLISLSFIIVSPSVEAATKAKNRTPVVKKVLRKLTWEMRKKLSPRPTAKADPRLDPKLQKAAELARQKAEKRSTEYCWRYTKRALKAAEVIPDYPKTEYAKDGADELIQFYGFKKLPIKNPYKAPVGALLFYSTGKKRSEGHVEMRMWDGFVSDFCSVAAFTECPKYRKHPPTLVWVLGKPAAAKPLKLAKRG